MKISYLYAAILLTFLPGISRADTTASAGISGLSFQLTDLNTADAYTPGLTWTTTQLSLSTDTRFTPALSLTPAGSGQFTWDVSFVDSALDYQSNTETFLAGLSSKTGGATATAGNGVLDVRATSTNAGGADYASAYAGGSFTLSPMTSLLVSGNISLGVNGSSSISFNLPANSQPGYAAAFSNSMSFVMVSLMAQGGTQSIPNLFSYDRAGGNFTPSSDGTLSSDAYSDTLGSTPFSFQLVNDTTASVNADFFAQMSANSSQIANPVPEPSTWLSMLSGLGLLAVCARRRTAHRA